MNKSKTAVANAFFETRRNFAQSRRFQLIHVPTGGIELVDGAQEIIRIARNRFRDEQRGRVVVGDLSG